MKLKQIINEIGDTIVLPTNVRYTIGEYKGYAKFDIEGDEYQVNVKIVMKDDHSIVPIFEFNANKSKSHSLTNKYIVLKVMQNVVGTIEEYLKRYIKKYGDFKIPYIRYNPKSEEDEKFDNDLNVQNVRDKLYRKYLENMARKYDTKVSFIVSNAVTAKFNPPLTIK